MKSTPQEMLVKFDQLAKAEGTDRDAPRQELITLIENAEKQSIIDFVNSEIEEAKKLAVLSTIVKLGQVELLTAIVTSGAFAELDLNDKRYQQEGLKLIDICAESMNQKDLDNTAKENYNKIYQI